MQVVRLREVREAKGIGQLALAKRSGVPQTTISAIETGERENPRIGTLWQLADALGCTVLDLWVPDEKSVSADAFEGGER